MLFALIVAVALASAFSFVPEPTAKEWTCISAQDDQKLTSSGSVYWRRENCTFATDGSQPLLVVNSIHVDLTASDIRITPGVSQDASTPLLPVGKMAATYTSKKLIAGINGGYFWRTDIDGLWIDDVCRGKIRREAEKPADPDHVDYGIHDGVVMIDKQTVGNNCDCWGYSRPAVIETTSGNTEWDIKVLHRGEKVGSTVVAALGAGPNLLSYSADKGTYVDIPSDDDNINIHEHAANTAVGINFVDGKANSMVFVTTDGSDECGRFDSSCGINAPNLATLMQIHFKVQQAMSMDQGGSTTLWVNGAKSANGDGVVSYAGGGARAVANGLFIEAL